MKSKQRELVWHGKATAGLLEALAVTEANCDQKDIKKKKKKTQHLQPKDTDWLKGYQNMTHIYAVFKKPTSDQKTHID